MGYQTQTFFLPVRPHTLTNPKALKGKFLYVMVISIAIKNIQKYYITLRDLHNKPLYFLMMVSRYAGTCYLKLSNIQRCG
jgi:hypothetical protein